MDYTDFVFDTVYDVASGRFFFQSEEFDAQHVHDVLSWARNLGFDVLLECRAVDGDVLVLRSKQSRASREGAERLLRGFLKQLRSARGRSLSDLGGPVVADPEEP